MPYTETPGFRMRYGTHGSGDPLLLINGLGSDSSGGVLLRPPRRVRRLVLACTAPGGEGSVRPDPEVLQAFVRSPGGDPEEEIRRGIPFLYSERYRQEHPEKIEEFVRRRLAMPVSAEGHAAQPAAAVGHSAWDRLGNIDAPTLVITGDGDRVVPPENSRRLAQRIPGAKLVILSGAPHPPFSSPAQAFNREVLAFLRE